MAAIFEQGVFSVVALSQSVLYARSFDSTEFGLFALIVSLVLVILGIQRSIIILPMMLSEHNHDGREDIAWLLLNLIYCVSVSTLLVVVALIFIAEEGVWRKALILSAILSPCMLLNEFNRRRLFMQRRPLSAAAASVVYAATLLCGLAYTLAFRPEIELAIATWAGAAVVSAVASTLLANKYSSFHKISNQRERLLFATWSFLSYLPYAAYNNATALILGLVSTIQDVATFATARIFITPIIALIQAVDSVDKPASRRAMSQEGLPGLTKSISSSRYFLLGLGLPYVLVVLGTSGVLPSLLFPKHGEDLMLPVILWASVGISMMMAQPSETGLLILGESKTVFLLRVLVLLLAALTFNSFRDGNNVQAAIAGLTIGWASSCALAYARLRYLGVKK
ncbi:hypothetical protein [Rhizobium rosettiformans]|uniref:hypothetical protein n=1 Tax=Rhizobium rosettiformans TaxID=1368430 RepID=UPI001932628D|nr:hypothetical protein [Rhizobium rosettiformans]